ncbi:MAG: OmpA family protein [Fluviicola sp.]|nr:OmpA family protein [Fluviicola sp.]
MKTAFLFLFALFTSISWSQSLQKANAWFDNYEYAKAADLYAKSKELPLEDYKRMTYSYYITGQYAKTLPLVDSILRTPNVEPMFYYIHAESSMGMGKYAQAKVSYIKYQELDDEFNVTNKIASCDYLPTVVPMKFVSNSPIGNNSSKADFTGGSFGKNSVYYRELGMDSLGSANESGDMSQAEFFLVRPIVISANGANNQILFPDSIKNFSVPSITLSENDNKVYFTVMQPMAQTEIDAVPHIYEGDYDAATFSVLNMEPWQYSGYADTSSTGYAALNSTGDRIVFSKIGSRTNGADLYYSDKNQNGWSNPQELMGVNSEMDEMFPLFMGDSLFSFASDGRLGYGGLDIYVAKVNGSTISEITHFSTPINSMNDDFNFVYYSADSARYSSNRPNGAGDDDIYFIKISEPKIIDTVVPINPFIANWVDQIIYFDFDKFTLKRGDKIIDELIEFLKSNNGITIAVTGHADDRGTLDYNDKLGLKRANQVRDELISLGVYEGQISVYTKGKGSPQVDCSQGCTEEDHAKNRFARIVLNK